MHLLLVIILCAGIYWEKLSSEKLGQIRIVRELKRRIEKETGSTLPCGPSEKLPPTAKRGRGRSFVRYENPVYSFCNVDKVPMRSKKCVFCRSSSQPALCFVCKCHTSYLIR
jgi:hypothetical protein